MTQVQFSEHAARIAAAAVIVTTLALAFPAAAFDSRYYTGASTDVELRAYNTGPLDNAVTWPSRAETPALRQTDAAAYFNGAASVAELHAYGTGPIDNAVTWPQDDAARTASAASDSADAVPGEAASGTPNEDPYWTTTPKPSGYMLRFDVAE